MASSTTFARVIFGLAAALLALLSVFFVFYTARLLYVTQGLQATCPGASLHPRLYSVACSAGSSSVGRCSVRMKRNTHRCYQRGELSM